MADYKQDDRDEKALKMLKASELAELVQRLHSDLEAGKKVGWDRMYKAIRWLDDPDKTRGWTRVFQLCRQYGKEKRMVKGIEVEYSMLPWENQKIWAPFIVDVYADLTAKLKEGDMLSILGFTVGRSLQDTRTSNPILGFLAGSKQRKPTKEGDDEKDGG